MDDKRNYKVALVLYTQGLDYDDRIRKEILSIQALFPNVKFKIFAVVPQNKEEEGVTSYGVPYRIPYLKSRGKYSAASHIITKAWDFYKSIRKDLKKYDAIWCADQETLFFVMMTCGKPIIWDLHELPELMMFDWKRRFLFRLLEKKTTIMIHANAERKDYLIETGLIKYPQKQYVIRNYPEQNVETKEDNLFDNFMKWKGEGKCVYLQGLSAKDRLPLQSVSAVMSTPDLKGVVVGKFPADIKNELIKKYGDKLEEKIFFTGLIPQVSTINYIRACYFGMVFYKCNVKNNIYCEPNRLFQCLVNGIPVIVGKNPTMKNLVNEYGMGIAMEGDGSDEKEIATAIQEMLNNYPTFYDNVQKNKERINWDYQDPILKEIVLRAL